tara:strand:+ start:10306 stop:11235 length:930 start_codon:yes stop_codon:yes gene_type:complete
VGVAAVAAEDVVAVVDKHQPPSRFSSLPVLGVGLGYRAPFRSDLFLHQEKVDFLEITAEHYLKATAEKRHELALLKEHFTLIPHALNLSLGSAEGVDQQYIDTLAALIEEVNPPWWSEHICFTRAGGVDIGHLSPLPFSQQALDILCRNIEKVQKTIKRPLILENITYAMPIPGGELDEAHFLRQLLQASDCGLLLDVTNLHTNATNHEYNPIDFLEALPKDRVVQLHFVGGIWQHGVLLDTHSQPTPPEVWDLMDEVLRRFPIKGAILERDEDIPAFSELTEELARARAIGDTYGRWRPTPETREAFI